MAVPVRTGQIDERRATQMAGSAALHERARKVFPDGVTHDGRYMEPFSLYCTHAEGPRKWDVDGNEFVDYSVGHGALLLGHATRRSSRRVIAAGAGAARTSAPRTNWRSQWGELVQQIVPSARARASFTSSGTEATMLAMRLARAFTGQATGSCKFARATSTAGTTTPSLGTAPPYDVPVSAGVPARRPRDACDRLPTDDLAALRASSLAATTSPPSSWSRRRVDASHRRYRQAAARAMTAARGIVADLRRGRHRLPLRRPAARRSTTASRPT